MGRVTVVKTCDSPKEVCQLVGGVMVIWRSKGA